MKRLAGLAIGCLLAGSALSACGGHNDDTAATSSPTKTTRAAAVTAHTPKPEPPKPSPTADDLGNQACDTFRIFVSDLDVKTGAQLVDEAQSIYLKWGRYSETAPVRQASHDIAAAVVAGDGHALLLASQRMSATCKQIGH